ncbi:ImmA/IrrE family metallo-endopeptidase [Fructobacillus fructosus]|uniref:ImmA/IrrE family metallo-endopeptidase n=1 Tax=Fructobacillus fructosus TaxID=1631 RepID=UPI002D964A68|nr:M78 family (ImmA) [Fructobacillus fructosus]CAK1247773.1 M78 family (ImmA) [Fructobacillus fructosus]CAK1247820.1 M78 family (ImmA) [Fructobacillus fructosus]
MEEILEELENIARQNEITIFDVDSLEKDTPDSSMSNNKLVLMNPAYKKSSYAFRLAHELSHIMYGNNLPDAVYQFSPYFQRGEEYEMHKHAIHMLMEIKRPSSVQMFMEVYRVPSWLEEYVESEYIQHI